MKTDAAAAGASKTVAEPTTDIEWESTSPLDFTADLETALSCDKVVIIGRESTSDRR